MICSMGKQIKILEVGDITKKQCHTLELSHDNVIYELIVACTEKNEFVAYINSCPHTGVNLNWQPNQCFDISERYLACSLHGALFQPDDGKCVSGPCRGQYLKSVELSIEGKDILVNPDTLKLLAT